MIEGLSDAFEGGRIPELPPALGAALGAHLATKLDTDLAFAVKAGDPEARARALRVIRDDKADTANRIALVQAFAEAGNREVVPAMLQIFNSSRQIPLRQGVLPLAGKFDDEALATAVLKGYEARFSQTQPLKDAAHRMLAGRLPWARLFLAEVDRSNIKPREVAPDVVRQLELYHDPELDRLLRKLWIGLNTRLSSQEKLAEAQRIKRLLASPGDAGRGHAVYTQRCAACHTLFGEGGKIGPDLTGYDRASADFWLVGLLDPSAEIREGFGAYTARLKGGQTLIGMLVQQDAGNVVLQDMSGQRHTARAADVEKLEAFPQSLMPEGLLSGLSDAELRDLFAYLMKPE